MDIVYIYGDNKDSSERTKKLLWFINLCKPHVGKLLVSDNLKYDSEIKLNENEFCSFYVCKLNKPDRIINCLFAEGRSWIAVSEIGGELGAQVIITEGNAPSKTVGCPKCGVAIDLYKEDEEGNLEIQWFHCDCDHAKIDDYMTLPEKTQKIEPDKIWGVTTSDTNTSYTNPDNYMTYTVADSVTPVYHDMLHPSTCNKCGSIIDSQNAIFCPKCGQSLAKELSAFERLNLKDPPNYRDGERLFTSEQIETISHYPDLEDIVIWKNCNGCKYELQKGNRGGDDYSDTWYYCEIYHKKIDENHLCDSWIWKHRYCTDCLIYFDAWRCPNCKKRGVKSKWM